jgi:hypothetical protein
MIRRWRPASGLGALSATIPSPPAAGWSRMNLHEYQSKKILARLRRAGAQWARCRYSGRSRRCRQSLGRQSLGRQGSGACWRSWQGRWRQAGARSGASAQRRGRHARPASGDQADRPRRSSDRARVCGMWLGDRARALSESDLESRARAHRCGRLGRRRHGHRGGGPRNPGEDPVGDHSSGGRPAALPVSPARFRAGSEGQADRAVAIDHRAGALSTVPGARCQPDRDQSADRHQAPAI